MRHILIAAAGFAACGLLVSTAVQAQTFEPRGPVFQAGGPERIGNMCKVTTDGEGNDSYGYYAPCAASAEAYEAPAPRRVTRGAQQRGY